MFKGRTQPFNGVSREHLLRTRRIFAYCHDYGGFRMCFAETHATRKYRRPIGEEEIALRVRLGIIINSDDIERYMTDC